MDPSDGNVLVAATNSGIYRTVDGGRTWDTAYTSPGRNRVQDLRVHPENFAIQYATAEGEAVLKSVDGGRSWQPKLTQFTSGVGRMELAVATSNPNIVYMSADGGSSSFLYRSRDGGETWKPVLESTGQHWLGAQGWYDQALAVHPYNENQLLLGGINLWQTTVNTEESNIRFLSDFQEVGTTEFMEFVNFNANYFGGRLLTGDAEEQASEFSRKIIGQ